MIRAKSCSDQRTMKKKSGPRPKLYSPEDMKEALEHLRAGTMNYPQASKHYNIPTSSLHRNLRGEKSLRKVQPISSLSSTSAISSVTRTEAPSYFPSTSSSSPSASVKHLDPTSSTEAGPILYLNPVSHHLNTIKPKSIKFIKIIHALKDQNKQIPKNGLVKKIARKVVVGDPPKKLEVFEPQEKDFSEPTEIRWFKYGMGHCLTEFEENLLVQWLLGLSSNGFILYAKDIKDIAKKIITSQGRKCLLKGGSRWLHDFMLRHREFLQKNPPLLCKGQPNEALWHRLDRLRSTLKTSNTISEDEEPVHILAGAYLDYFFGAHKDSHSEVGAHCSLKGCSNLHTVTSQDPKRWNIRYHCFPTDKPMKEVWERLCVPEPEMKHICSVHFKESDYLIDIVAQILGFPPTRRLKKEAVPRLIVTPQYIMSLVSGAIPLNVNPPSIAKSLLIENQDVPKPNNDNSIQQDHEESKNNTTVSHKKNKAKDKPPSRRNCAHYDQIAIDEALHCIRSKALTLSEACRKYNIPKSTLHNRVMGKTADVARAGSRRVLSDDEENWLAAWILALKDRGFLLSIIDVLDLVQSIVERNIRKTTFKGNRPTKKWVRDFITRKLFNDTTALLNGNVSSDPLETLPGRLAKLRADLVSAGKMESCSEQILGETFFLYFINKGVDPNLNASCCVLDCGNKHSETSQGADTLHTQYHPFPGDRRTREVWARACNSEGEMSYVCSMHFTKQDYLSDEVAVSLGFSPTQLLKISAVPTLHLPKPPHPYKKELENISRFCRLCASPAQDMVSIFRDQKQDLMHIIHKLLPIEVSTTDSSTLKICNECYEQLKSCEELAQKCVNAASKIKEIVEIQTKLETAVQVWQSNEQMKENPRPLDVAIISMPREKEVAKKQEALQFVSRLPEMIYKPIVVDYTIKSTKNKSPEVETAIESNEPNSNPEVPKSRYISSVLLKSEQLVFYSTYPKLILPKLIHTTTSSHSSSSQSLSIKRKITTENSHQVKKQPSNINGNNETVLDCVNNEPVIEVIPQKEVPQNIICTPTILINEGP